MREENSIMAAMARLCVGVAAWWIGGVFAWAATPAEIAQKVNRLLEADAVKSVQPAPMAGLYEVALKSGELIYTNEAVTHFLVGALIDAKTRENVTEKRLEALNRIDFATLPFADAIVVKKGDGKRVLASFEDPNCGFCKRLTKELRGMENVTRYVFLYPVLGADSQAKAKAIWCAPNRTKAWLEWMVEGKAPEGKTDCDTGAIERNVALGKRLGIGGTPTLFLKDGSRISGFLPAARLEERLKAVP